jgi:Ca2+-binding RTX toxin-like protein
VRRPVLAGAGALAAIALFGAPEPGPAAPARCSFDGTTATVELRGRSATRVRIATNGRLLVDDSPCGEASAATLGSMSADGGRGPQRLTLELAGSGFGTTPIAVELGGAEDTVVVHGTAARESHRVDGSGLILDGGARAELGGVDRVAFDTAGGEDTVTVNGWRQPMRVSGGAGRDRLDGGRAADRIEGGRGRDRCDGRAGTDTLISCTPPFRGVSSPLSQELRDRMTGKSWRPGCPVGLDDLRLVIVSHWNLANRDVRRGRLVVHKGVDGAVLRAMRSLLRAGFEIRRMELIDRYGGDDHRSMNADNTSAFNCRFVSGTTRWSEHAYGRAIDVNPIENPYVDGGHVSPPAGRRYADRSRRSPGMVHRGGAAVEAFARVGWEWGGDWRPARDYQHFSERGR